jgi:hypothetical protein
MEKKYYVYKFCYSDGTIFYVGKGSGKRWKCINPNGRNKKFLEIIKNNEYYSEIIQNDLTQEEAIKLENELVNTIPNLCNVFYGNITDGDRKCSKCGEVKSIVNFTNNSSKSAKCKDCLYKDNREWITKSHYKGKNDKSYAKIYYEENKEELLKNMKEYQEENKEELRKYRREYYRDYRARKKLEKNTKKD